MSRQIDAADAFMEAEKPQMPETLEQQNEDSVPRDWKGAPRIRRDDGKLHTYYRASGFGNLIEDDYHLVLWQKRQVARGMALDARRLVPTALALKDIDDLWIKHPKHLKDGLNSIVDQAEYAAGNNLKSELGTQIHAATEFIDRGDDLAWNLREFSPMRRRHLIERADAYWKFVTELGFKYSEIEEFGVQDDVWVAGTTDRIGWVPFYPETPQCVIDVKTSSSMEFAGTGFAVQLAVYARSDRYDGKTETRTPREGMNLKRGLIIHVDREVGGPVSLAKVDIETGWQHALIAREIVLARRIGRELVLDMTEEEMAILTAPSRQALKDLLGTGAGWTRELRELANERWKVVA